MGLYCCPVCGAIVHQEPVRGKEDAIICRDGGAEHMVVERWSGDEERERDHLADVSSERENLGGWPLSPESARRLYPRVDRVIAKPRGRLRKWLGRAPRTRVLRGAPHRAASLAAPHGAQDVPSGWRHMGDIVAPSGQALKVRFRGPFDVA